MIEKLAVNPQQMSSSNTMNPKPMTGVDISNQFSSFLNDAIEKTNQEKATVDTLTAQFISGDLTDVHQLMIASEKASLGLELTVQVRNKVIEAYQEIMRMQI